MLRILYCITFFGLAGAVLWAQTAANVLVVKNKSSAVACQIADYYVQRRAIPAANVCDVQVSPAEEVPREEYNKSISKPIADCLRSRHLEEKILYIVTTLGLPLRIPGEGSYQGDIAAVDSELTLLYSDMKGKPHELRGPLRNPFFGQRDAPFTHPQFPIYLVTRLAGYDLSDVKAIIDKSLAAKNTGKFVLDLRSDEDETGNDWLRNAAILLPNDRTVFDESTAVLYGQKNVIGFASWGSNDKNRKQRLVGFSWLPGAIMTEFVSTNARTFEKPPAAWNIGAWDNPKSYFKNAPQTLTADYIHEGATGASGHVNEPFLVMTPRPDFLFPAYYSGRNLAESFYLSIPGLSWQNIVVGDPLCTLGKP
ncbi:MAG TPA: TIGR03790 family protein [Bryobacteraceae bacterium]|nr:TIGR03790 family protein [Bryobacteraceae bacterium]